MDIQSSKRTHLCLALLLGGVLSSSVAQASTDISNSLLPPATAQTLQQTAPLAEQKENKALSQNEIIDQATSQSADAHVITKNKDGSVRIPSPMQDVVATLTSKGANFQSIDNVKGDFALHVNGFGRDKGKLTKIKPGKISSDEKIARLFHNNLVEEFTTNSGGIRQDFVIPHSPKGKGKLVLELDISGASIALSEKGVQLTLKDGRELAYHSLLVADASGKTLDAHFAIQDKNTLRIIVDDKGAQYPVRIDPTITDADWFLLGNNTNVGMSGDVRVIVPDGLGNLYVGGSFTLSDSYNISMWDGSSWSALGAGMDDEVNALAWDGSNLYAGGAFTIAGGVTVNGIARWDGSSWNALGSGVSGGNRTVSALVWDGINLYAGGDFTTAGGVTVNHIARWDGSSWNALGTGMDALVKTLAWDGSNLYAGGIFTTAGGVTVNYIARWDGSGWNALGTGMDASVWALAWDGSNLYAGGYFNTAGGMATNRIARWDGGSWNALGTGMDAYISTLTWDGASLYAGGDFTTAGGVTTNRVARWDGSSWYALGTGMSTLVKTLAWDGTNLYAGGDFSSAGGVTADRIARWDGSNWNPMGVEFWKSVTSMVGDGTNLYIGTNSTIVDGVTVNFVARWDGNSWNALGTGMNGSVGALLWDGNNLYAGGGFTNAGGVTVNRIARWDGSSWNALGTGMDDSVSTLTWDGSNLYAGGSFTTAGGATVNHIAKWNGSNWQALGSGLANIYSTFKVSVSEILWGGDKLYVAGYFEQSGSVITGCLAQWDGSAWSGLGAPQGHVYALPTDFCGDKSYDALAWDGANLYVGGEFDIDTEERLYFDDVIPQSYNVAKWDGTNWSHLGGGLGYWDLADYQASYWGYPYPYCCSRVNSLLWNKGRLYAGGDFTHTGGVAAGGIAMWNGIDWNPLGSGVASYNDYLPAINQSTQPQVYTLAWNNDRLYIGGRFHRVGDKNTALALAGLHLIIPDPLLFADVTDAAFNTVVNSEILNITGIQVDTDITITGGEYRLNGGDWTAAAGTVSNGDSLQLRTTSSTSYSVTTDVAVTIGHGGAIWKVTTVSGMDPNPFSFTDQANLTTGVSVISNLIIISGLDVPAPISITGGEYYDVNTGTYTNSDGIINNGDFVLVRTVSSANDLTAVDVVLTVGNFSDTFTVTTGDTSPTQFSFSDQTDVAPSGLVTSNSINVSGITAAAPISVTDGEYSINGGAYTSSPGLVIAGSNISVRHYSSANISTTVNTVLTIGGVNDTFSSTTSVNDTSPDQFTFVDQTDVTINTLITSNTVVVSGINTAASITVTGGEYSINGGVFITSVGTVNNGDSIVARHTSGATEGAVVNTTLSIGNVNGTFSTTTFLTDTTPDQFAFVDQTDVPSNTLITSEPIVVSGINTATSISITGGEYSINGGAFTAGAGTVNNGDIVVVRHTSAATGNSFSYTELAIGDISDWFTSRTLIDSIPDAFSFTDQLNAPLSTMIYSNAINIIGFNASTPISITDGEYSINGGAYTSVNSTYVVSAVIKNTNFFIRVRTNSPSIANTTTNVVLTIGGVSDTFSVTATTAAVDDAPDQFTFIDQTGVPVSTWVVASPVQITGINSPATINGNLFGAWVYSINGAPYTNATAVVNNGDILTVKHSSAATFLTTKDSLITIGGVSDTFSSTTQAADNIPDAFAFVDQTSVALNTIINSNTVTIAGLNSATPISVTGGEYSINGDAYTSVSGNINVGGTVTLRVTSSLNGSTPLDVVLTIGGVSDTFTVTTEADTDGDGIGNTLDTNDDNDGYLDTVDNCILIANNQLDTDGDGFGNACDSDFNNDGISNALDLGLFKTAFFTAGPQQTDINGDNMVNSLDLGLFKQQFMKVPGPSGLIP